MSNEIAEALASNFVLIDLTVRKWSGKSVDRKATEETITGAGACSGAGKFIKSAMSGADSELRECISSFDAVRTYLYSHSLPYSSSMGVNRGPRLVATKNSMQVIKGLQERIGIAEQSIDALIAVYNERLEEAMRNLGGLANRSDYPTETDLRNMFGVHIDILPVPSTGDFSRTSVPVELAKGLGERMVRQQAAVMQAAVTDLRKRLLTEVKRIATQMGKYSENGNTRLYNTLTTNIRGLVELLDDSNITGSPEVSELVESIRDKLCKHDVAEIKKYPQLAAEVAKGAEKIAIDIDNIEWF